jgi:2-polyprenyl-3-methyl-5-hydroxy-6-metoxy-1,4-benzoquinol methylase
VSDACWVCDGPTQPAAELAPLPFRRCSVCGFLFRRDLDEPALRGIYEGGEYEVRDFAAGYAVDETVDERRRNARSRLAWVLEHKRSGRLLDVGAAAGAFVYEASLAGFEAFGIEPSPSFARQARETLGVDVRDGRVEDIDLPSASLDAVTLWHVLEHVREPRASLERLLDWLIPGGLLMLEVPNVDSVMFSLLGRNWPHLDPDVHVNQFTPSTLTLLLERAGFTAVRTATVSHTTYLTPLERLRPRAVVHRLQLARQGAPSTTHPSRHELLRASARRPVR